MNGEASLPDEKDVRFFEEKGYWRAGRWLGDAELEALRRAHGEVLAGRYETGRAPYALDWNPGEAPHALCTVDNSHWASRAIRQLFDNPLLGESAARLMRTPEVRLWQDQLFEQPGQAPAVGWRQNALAWRCTIFNLVSAWVALDDVAQEQGCLQVVPGSHRWGLFEESDFSDASRYAPSGLLEESGSTLKRQAEARAGREWSVVSCELKAGEVVFSHCLAIQGFSANLGDRSRRSLAVHLQPAHAYYVPGTADDGHMNVVLLRQSGGHAGDLFQGEAWPVLFPRGTPKSQTAGT